jgi:predicted N-acetyltransferase YhbS
MKNIIINKAAEEDLSEIFKIQKIAFGEVAKKYKISDLPPLRQTFKEIQIEFMNCTFLKAVIGDKIVGSVRAYIKDYTCNINKLIVLPDYQNKGIGLKLMYEIENEFKDVVHQYELFTGSRDSRNKYLYEKLGYEVFKKQKLNDQITFIFMRKVLNTLNDI